jgi:hypothetical protein
MEIKVSTIAIAELRRCKKCQTLYNNGSSSSKGFCPADGRKHEETAFNFQLMFGIPQSDAQSGWRRCKRCEAIFFNNDEGRCAADPNAQEHHTPDMARDLRIPHGRPETEHVQAGWEFCTKCNVLFYARSDEPNMNHCTAGGEHAFNPGAFHFTLVHGQPLPVKLD